MARNGILVTGGTGLVGAYVAGMLLDRGERPVVFDVALNERLLRAVEVDVESISLVRGDILDLPGLVSVIRDHEIDRIVHLAAFLGEEVQRRPYSGVRLNLLGTVNVLEAARLEKVSRVVFPSSGTVYLGSLGEGVEKIDETIPPNPLSIYGATKVGSEYLGRTYAKHYGFEFVCVRYTGGLYGPSPAVMKATRELAIQAMVRAALRGEAAGITWPYGPSELLYGKDAAKGTVLACLKDKPNSHLFHIGSSEMASGEDILKTLKKHFPDSKITLLKGEKPMPYPETRVPSDFSLSRDELGYEPDYPLERALRDYAATMKKLEGL
ncbi:MAG: NAD(P)-dependent oxidoreductase [Candidatus Binatia bacterium]|nr:NAD(P)-dependent oxidoreductase [Candidatus Binatia bacterium]